MKRFSILFTSAAAFVLLLQALPATAQVTRSTYKSSSSRSSVAPVAKKVTVGATVYAIVEGNNPALDTGREACASWKQNFLGYKNLSANTVCKAAHPTAKLVTGVNGSKNGFYCNGAPQKGLACEKAMNTCMVCPNCNINATADTQIGGLFAEMYASCGGTLASSSSKSSVKSSVSSRSSSSVSSVAAGLHCKFKQGGTLVRATCNVAGAAGNFCVRAMGLASARAVSCVQNGEIDCVIPCGTQGIANLTRCPTGATTTAPTGSCPKSSSSSSKSTRTVQLGGLCKTQADCVDTNSAGKQIYVHCVGFSPNTRCSCNPNNQTTGGCQLNYANTTNQPTGAGCVHGGNCKSGVCLGTVCK